MSSSIKIGVIGDLDWIDAFFALPVVQQFSITDLIVNE